MVNASALASLTMAFDTIAFIPWISETTATMEVTATMLPRTVINDRSLLPQIVCSANQIDSANCMDYRGGFSFTEVPSAICRTESNGPITTWSPGFNPDSTSK